MPRGVKSQHRTCTWEGCDKPHKSSGLCGMHAQRKKNGTDMDAPAGFKNVNQGRKCSVSWCETEAHCKGLCKLHYEHTKRLEMFDA